MLIDVPDHMAEQVQREVRERHNGEKRARRQLQSVIADMGLGRYGLAVWRDSEGGSEWAGPKAFGSWEAMIAAQRLMGEP